MHKSGFLLFFTLFLSCLVTSQGTSASMFSRFSINKKFGKLVNGRKENKLFDPSGLLIDESRLTSSSQTGQKEADRIDRLPGQPPNVAFKQYSGYVKVNPKTAKAFYYYFVEAQMSPGTSPLLLWLNGGPGCSSLGFGAMEELGPFRVQSDGKTLYPNDYAWNRVANVLFVESPAGVGFSYSNNTDDFVSGGDNQTAVDNYVFLKNWLEKFSEYKTRDVYISGESYAGHYVPQLAQIILHQNKRAKTPSTVNLKGIMIGNALINDETDYKGMYEYWGSHALISDDLTNQILKYCEGSAQQKKCDKLKEKTYSLYDQINIYNIYWPLCHDSNLTDKPKKYSIFEFDPCSENYVDAYLNRLDVQKALHVVTNKNIPYKWKSCNKALRENWTDWAFSVLPSLKELMQNGIRLWIFSGDVDGILPVTGTQLSIKEMKLQIKDSWRPWYSTKREVAGYTQVYKGDLTFATVRGAGHQVPMYKPESALLLITHFLKGKKLPSCLPRKIKNPNPKIN